MCITSYLHAYENEIPCPSLLRLLSSRNTKNEAETGVFVSTQAQSVKLRFLPF
jgi:hypothetical protein